MRGTFHIFKTKKSILGSLFQQDMLFLQKIKPWKCVNRRAVRKEIQIPSVGLFGSWGLFVSVTFMGGDSLGIGLIGSFTVLFCLHFVGAAFLYFAAFGQMQKLSCLLVLVSWIALKLFVCACIYCMSRRKELLSSKS